MNNIYIIVVFSDLIVMFLNEYINIKQEEFFYTTVLCDGVLSWSMQLCVLGSTRQSPWKRTDFVTAHIADS